MCRTFSDYYRYHYVFVIPVSTRFTVQNTASMCMIGMLISTVNLLMSDQPPLMMVYHVSLNHPHLIRLNLLNNQLNIVDRHSALQIFFIIWLQMDDRSNVFCESKHFTSVIHCRALHGDFKQLAAHHVWIFHPSVWIFAKMFEY